MGVLGSSGTLRVAWIGGVTFTGEVTNYVAKEN